MHLKWNKNERRSHVTSILMIDWLIVWVGLVYGV